MKRKEFQEVDDDFSSPSLYSPSTKSRRLDSEFLRSSEAAAMVDVQEATMGEELEPQNVDGGGFRWNNCPAGDEIPVVDNPHEKAIVLYQPLPQSLSSPQLSIVLDSNLIPGLKVPHHLSVGLDYIYWPGSSMEAKLAEGKLAVDKSIRGSNDNLAVVPWVASQPPKFSASSRQVAGSSEGMEEGEEIEMMDTDESDYNSRSLKDFEAGGMASEGEVQQWPQPQLPQQCFVPGVMQNPSTPVSW